MPDTDKLRRQGNARLFVGLSALAVVLAVALGVTAYRYRVLNGEIDTNRDGIACMLETLLEHRANDTPSPTVLDPTPDEVTGSCARFFRVQPPGS